MDSELDFAIQPNTTGKQLFDQVSRTRLSQWIESTVRKGSILISRLLFLNVDR